MGRYAWADGPHPARRRWAWPCWACLEVGPLHPYGMQRLIKLWGKDQVVNVGQRANLYRIDQPAPRGRA